VTARDGRNKATALEILQHIILSHPKLTTALFRRIDLNNFCSKTKSSKHLKMFVHSTSETGPWTSQKIAWVELPLWLVCTSWHKK